MGGAFTPAPAEGFRHLASQLVAALGEPGHSMQDVIAAEGAAIAVHGKFAYGPMSNDLEDERVRVFVHGCSGFQSLGDATTDGDGRIAFPVPALPVGVYDVRLEVLGDESTAAGRVWVLPRGTHIAVSDVDGTLTTSDGELVQDVLTDFFGPIFSGDDIPSAYPGAADLTRALADRGYVLLYLTGRPYWLTGKTRAWLADGGFALGALHTTDSNGEALPVDTGVGAFKLAFLEALAAQGLLVDEAYGNATTDVYAYAGAGIPAASTWIIGPNAGLGGTNAVTGSWAARAAEVQALPPIAQPFVH
jgi:phosphatidate phosphatase PAH1